MRHLLSFALACTTCLPGAHAEPAPPASVTKAIAARLPHTKITHVDCSVLPGLCEVQAGSTLFYTDPNARFLVVGHVYDLDTHNDLTAARLLAINPDSVLPTPDSAHHVEPPVPGSAAQAVAQTVSLTDLPASGAIEWGGKGPHVTIFTDFHCGYCKLLHQALKDMGARVTERPISVLGTREISNAVLCAENPGEEADKAYAGNAPAARNCDTAGLDANEAFARAHGFSGTPVMVRDDGSVVLGYRPREFLEAWLKGGN